MYQPLISINTVYRISSGHHGKKREEMEKEIPGVDNKVEEIVTSVKKKKKVNHKQFRHVVSKKSGTL